MRIWMLAAGAAALAITTPALADRGGGHGQGGGRGGSAQAQRGGGGQAKAHGGQRGGQMQAQRGGDRARGQQVRMAQPHDRRHENARIESRGADRARAARLEGNRGQGKIRNEARMGRVDDLVRERGNGARFVNADKVFKVRDFDRGAVRVRDVDPDDLFMRRVGWGDAGCPPGLAKKAVPCVPPGQAAKLVGSPLAAAARVAALEPLPGAIRPLFLDTDDYYYRYGGGYMYRVDRNDSLISAMIPLFGSALLGQPLQSAFINSYNQPSYFNAFYPNSPYDCYRYGYGYVYETDCMTGMVEDVIPTYDYGYGVGQMMPASYGYYNVPYAYRGYFPNGGDYNYRYAPGAIYQVDPSTSLITAVAALLTRGLGIGQRLPLGYSAYNVPLAYRSTYYDRPDVWYRYDNGYIYAVDPGTQLVTSIVRALV